MRKNIFISVSLILILSVAIGISFSENKKKNYDQVYKQVELFSDTLAIIHKEYVQDTKIKDLIYGALKGTLAALDPYSQFMDPDTYNELKVDALGKYGGIGIEITVKDTLLTVITPIEDTPAWKAGIKSGDRILKINGALTRDMVLTDAVKKLRGPPGAAVNITVLRDMNGKVLKFKIIREIIKIKGIRDARILENGIGYIRMSDFSENTLPELNSALNSLSKKKMKGLIIDLRNNPGGLLDVAVKVAGRFIAPNKMVVYTKGRQKKQDLEFFSEGKNAVLDLPLVILINEGSASGSEIVAAALQDYKRAIVIGTKSFGKGSVQTVIPLGDGSALRLTTSHYFSPLGRIIQDKGVAPDILVKTEEADSKEPEDKPKKTENAFVPRKELDYKTDAQIMRAVNSLQAIGFYKEFTKDEK